MQREVDMLIDGVTFISDQVIRFRYENWKGVVSDRIARVEALVYASTEWHRELQWLVRAFDVEKHETSLFSLRDMVPL